MVVTVNGKAELVVQDAEAYQALLDRIETTEGIQRGLDVKAGQGAKWFNGLERAVLSLDAHPKRCPVAAESSDRHRQIRVLSFGRKPRIYRVFFTVDDSQQVVHVVHVRRGARRPATREELRASRTGLTKKIG
jgi:hypothetical protein